MAQYLTQFRPDLQRLIGQELQQPDALVGGVDGAGDVAAQGRLSASGPLGAATTVGAPSAMTVSGSDGHATAPSLLQLMAGSLTRGITALSSLTRPSRQLVWRPMAANDW